MYIFVYIMYTFVYITYTFVYKLEEFLCSCGEVSHISPVVPSDNHVLHAPTSRSIPPMCAMCVYDVCACDVYVVCTVCAK